MGDLFKKVFIIEDQKTQYDSACEMLIKLGVSVYPKNDDDWNDFNELLIDLISQKTKEDVRSKWEEVLEVIEIQDVDALIIDVELSKMHQIISNKIISDKVNVLDTFGKKLSSWLLWGYPPYNLRTLRDSQKKVFLVVSAPFILKGFTQSENMTYVQREKTSNTIQYELIFNRIEDMLQKIST